MNSIQILGYAASSIVLISLMMKSLAKLRIINAVGSLFFVVFALKTGSLPTVFLNSGIVIIDIYYFICMVRVKDNFEVMVVQKNNEIVLRFYRINKKEVDALFGKSAFEQSEKVALFFRNDDIAGILGYCTCCFETESAAEILIDFVVPKYRNFAVGRYFFIHELSFWKGQGYNCLLSNTPDKRHMPYLKRLGFVKQNNSALWKKDI